MINRNKMKVEIMSEAKQKQIDLRKEQEKRKEKYEVLNQKIKANDSSKSAKQENFTDYMQDFVMLEMLSNTLKSLSKHLRDYKLEKYEDEFKETQSTIKAKQERLDDVKSQIKDLKEKNSDFDTNLLSYQKIKDLNFKNEIIKLLDINDSNKEDALAYINSNEQQIKEQIKKLKIRDVNDELLEFESKDEFFTFINEFENDKSYRSESLEINNYDLEIIAVEKLNDFEKTINNFLDNRDINSLVYDKNLTLELQEFNEEKLEKPKASLALKLS